MPVLRLQCPCKALGEACSPSSRGPQPRCVRRRDRQLLTDTVRSRQNLPPPTLHAAAHSNADGCITAQEPLRPTSARRTTLSPGHATENVCSQDRYAASRLLPTEHAPRLEPASPPINSHACLLHFTNPCPLAVCEYPHVRLRHQYHIIVDVEGTEQIQPQLGNLEHDLQGRHWLRRCPHCLPGSV